MEFTVRTVSQKTTQAITKYVRHDPEGAEITTSSAQTVGISIPQKCPTALKGSESLRALCEKRCKRPTNTSGTPQKVLKSWRTLRKKSK
jgi:hypothetical protein